jgi:hypothetical protein
MGVLLSVEKNREEERNGWKKKNEKGWNTLKKPVKYLIHVKTNQGKTVNSWGTKKNCGKRKIERPQIKGQKGNLI